jgi:hypothetical protein
MVKRILTILFFLVHTVTQAGTVLNVHYCMGDLASISIGTQEDESCPFCGMRDESCCHDEQRVIKQFDTSCLVNSMSKVDFYLPDFNVRRANVKLASVPVICCFITENFSPSGSPPIYLKNCIFRI